MTSPADPTTGTTKEATSRAVHTGWQAAVGLAVANWVHTKVPVVPESMALEITAGVVAAVCAAVKAWVVAHRSKLPTQAVGWVEDNL